MKSKLKMSELEAMAMAMTQVANTTVSPKFAYAIAKNRKRIMPEVEALQDARKPLKEFDTKRIELCKEMCDKDENGKPITETTEVPGGHSVMYKGIAGNPEFDAKHEELKKPYATQFKEIEELEKKEVECDFHQISLSQFPKEITSAVVMALMPLIREESEESEEAAKKVPEIPKETDAKDK